MPEFVKKSDIKTKIANRIKQEIELPGRVIKTTKVAWPGITKNKKAIPRLTEVMQSKNESHRDRVFAINSLGKIGHSDAIPAMKSEMEKFTGPEFENKEDKLRAYMLVKSIAKIGGIESAEALVQNLNHENEFIRFHSNKLFMEMDMPQLEKALDENDREVRNAIVKRLNEVGEQKFITKLVKDHANANKPEKRREIEQILKIIEEEGKNA